MNDVPELYPLSSVNTVIPTTKPHGLYFALRYLYEGYDDIVDPWEESKPKPKLKVDYDLADVDSLLKKHGKLCHLISDMEKKRNQRLNSSKIANISSHF